MPKHNNLISALNICRTILCGCLLWLSCCNAQAGTKKRDSIDFSPVRSAMLSITSYKAKNHVIFLAGDELAGRETGTTGQWLAAKYIAREFARDGLQPIMKNRKYYQNFHLTYPGLKNAELIVHLSDKAPIIFKLNRDFVPFVFSGENSFTAPLVFAGFGITAPEYHYDDYANIDVRGKIVLVMRHEPQENDSTSIFAGVELTPYAYFETKAKNAMKHGAVAMFIVNDPANHHFSHIPDGNWQLPSSQRVAGHRWQIITHSNLENFPALWVQEPELNALFNFSNHSLLRIQKQIDHSRKPESFTFNKVDVQVTVEKIDRTKSTQNVLAFMPGSDPLLKNDVVIIGAHYDHLGKKQGRIFHGADDNASGTAGLLEIAKAFTKLPFHPRRSILFIAFSGEEMGLLGSEYYVKHPAFALDKTVAMINLDMISRNAADEVSIIGTNSHPYLNELNEIANEEIGLHLHFDGKKYLSRSDQANFVKYHVPVIFYNSDVHEDYHKPTDTANKINPEKIARISRLAFLVAWELANGDFHAGVNDSYMLK